MKALEDLEAAFAAATQGEWESYLDGDLNACISQADLPHNVVVDAYGEGNARLIVLMHNNLPALIECAEALRGLTTVCDAGQSADYRALQELRTMREARAALAKLENAR